MDALFKELMKEKLGEDAVKMYETAASSYGTVSFAQLMENRQAQEMADRIYELSGMFRVLCFNIIYNDEIENKIDALEELATEYVNLAKGIQNQVKSNSLIDWVKELNPFTTKEAFKTEGGKKFPRSAYLYAPGDEPSKWKLRIQDMSGKVTKEQLGAAAAAFSPGGFRGNKVQLPSEAVASVKSKLRSEYKKLGVKREDMPDSIKELDEGFYVFKDANLKYRWLAIHTNNYEDRDKPKEIIASYAHKEFVEAVEEGRWPYPELWVWHATNSSRVGVADMLHYDEPTGFMFSTGTFDDDKEHVAKGLDEYPYPLRTSHGMPKDYLIYEGGYTFNQVKELPEPHIVAHYRTKEISPLPYGAEANQLVAFSLLNDGGL